MYLLFFEAKVRHLPGARLSSSSSGHVDVHGAMRRRVLLALVLATTTSSLAVAAEHHVLRSSPETTRFGGWSASYEVRPIHWFPYDRAGVVNADP